MIDILPQLKHGGILRWLTPPAVQARSYGCFRTRQCPASRYLHLRSSLCRDLYRKQNRRRCGHQVSPDKTDTLARLARYMPDRSGPPARVFRPFFITLFQYRYKYSNYFVIYLLLYEICLFRASLTVSILSMNRRFFRTAAP